MVLLNRGPTSFFLVGRSGLVTWKRAGSSWWLFFVSHWYTSPSPRRSSGRRGLLASGGRARFAGASALCTAAANPATCIALLARLRGCDTAALSGIASCTRRWRINVATQVEYPQRCSAAMIQAVFCNISCKRAAKKAASTRTRLSRGFISLLHESSGVASRSPLFVKAGGPRRRAARQLPAAGLRR